MPRPTTSSGRPASGGTDPFIAQIRASFGTDTVKVIHADGTDDESSFEVEAHIQPERGMFAISTPVYVGDVVEVPDPRGGVDRRLAETINIYKIPSKRMSHTEVLWGTAPPPRVAPVRRLTFENLHANVQSAAGDLFADGHFDHAVAEAFKLLEVRVRHMTGLELVPAKLMGEAFKTPDPLLDVSSHDGQSGKDEREGFLHIFRGSMIGIRNPGAHELMKPGDPQQALEYLGMASLLHRRLDVAEQNRA